MRILSRGAALGCSLPALRVIAINPATGRLEDIESGEWTITDSDGAETGPVAIDTADCPAGHRLGLGFYAIAWTIPNTAKAGTWDALATFSFEAGGPQSSQRLVFEIIERDAGNPLAPVYASIESLRCEGFTERRINDQQLARRLKLASAMVDGFTGNRFEAEAKQIRVTGKGSNLLHLREPIIALGLLQQEFGGALDQETSDFDLDIVDLDDVRIANRHISQGLTRPDDRFNPKIERLFGSFGRRPQGVVIDGVFGFTEANGTPTGSTPMLIEHATRLLVLRNIDKLSSGRRQDRMTDHLVSEERTLDQQRKFDRPNNDRTAIGAFTGDPEIDTILEDHRAPYSIA